MVNMKSSHVWQVVERWLEGVPFPPNQSKIAEHVGVSRSAVSDWKSGKTRPAPEHLRALGQMMAPQLGPEVHVMLSMALLEDLGYGVDTSVNGVLKVILGETAAANFGTSHEPESIRDAVEHMLSLVDERRRGDQRRGGDGDADTAGGPAPMKQQDDYDLAADDGDGLTIEEEQGHDEHP